MFSPADCKVHISWIMSVTHSYNLIVQQKTKLRNITEKLTGCELSELKPRICEPVQSLGKVTNLVVKKFKF